MTRSQYDDLIRDLMYEDPNASWNEILGECGGDVGAAVVVLHDSVWMAIHNGNSSQTFADVYQKIIANQ